MNDSGRLRRYKKEIQKKRLMLLMIASLAAGVFLGSAVGSANQKQKSKKQAEALIEEVKAEESKKSKKLEKELAKKEQEDQEKELPWNLMLVNAANPMPEGYVPELTVIEGDYSVDSRIAEPLKEMLAASAKEGLHVQICSAYRSVEKQTQVFNSSVQDRLNTGMNYWEAYRDTSLSVAFPGTSEHGMGMALDLISNQYTELDEKQAETAEAKWLAENCYKYGFILRYPPDKTDETGIIYEPWHYRYVGKEDAEKIMKSGVTLETYLEENY